MNGKQQRDYGIQLSLDHAEMVNPGWQTRAMEYLKSYIGFFPAQFKTEDFRQWAEKEGLEKPPHLRAYGGIIRSAAFQKLIEKVGYTQVENPKAHAANCAVWCPIKNAA